MDSDRAPTPETAVPGASASRPPATVLVCTAGRERLLLETLKGIITALGPDDELVVVEARSETAAEAVGELGEGPWRALRIEEPGKSRQLNAGIRAASGEVVVITDDDCRVRPGWVDAMATAFTEPDVGITFGPVRGLSEIPGIAAVETRRFPGPAPLELWAYSHGAAMAVRVAAALDVGGFDERLGPGAAAHGEEADLALRMEADGWRCWIADAPAVEHVEWRTSAEDIENRLVYERGAGAWLGAALRRDPRTASELLRLRLRYQAALIRNPTTCAHGREALAAFGAGLARGLRLEPRRFLDQPRSLPHHRPSSAQRSPLAALPWPVIEGKRCLEIGPGDGPVARELERRRAAEIVTVLPVEASLEAPAPARRVSLEELSAGALGSFDLVVCDGLLTSLPNAADLLAAVRSLCDGFFLSIESIDPLLTLTARGRPRARIDAEPRASRPLLNGAAHRLLLEAAGLEIHCVSRPFSRSGNAGRHGESGRARPLRALAAWILTGEATATVQRAILCRVPPLSDR